MWIADAALPSAVESAVLCLATAGDRLDAVQVVLVDEQAVLGIGPLEPTPGETPVSSLAHLHRDLVGLDCARLGVLAEHVRTSIGTEGRFRLFRKAEVKQMIRDAIDKGLVAISALHDKLRQEIEKASAKSE